MLNVRNAHISGRSIDEQAFDESSSIAQDEMEGDILEDDYDYNDNDTNPFEDDHQAALPVQNTDNISSSDGCNLLFESPRITHYERILQLPERDFRNYFQLSQKTAIFLVRELVGYDLKCRMGSDDHTSALCEFLIAFHYFSTGEYEFELAPEHLHCPSLKKLNKPFTVIQDIIVKFAHIILRQKRYLRFPKNIKGQNRLLKGFVLKFGILHTLGCMDCLHVSIGKPTKDPFKYVNRHAYESLSVETICDSNMMFLSVRIFPGSTSDCYSFSTSPVRENLSEILSRKRCHINSVNWLLCDRAYPVDTFLLPPYEDPLQDHELNFNDLHMKVFDGTIKRALELVRTTFKCLLQHRPIDFEPEDSTNIILACFILYNILLKQGDIDFGADVFQVDDMDESYTKLNSNHSRNCPTGQLARNTYAKTLISTALLP